MISAKLQRVLTNSHLFLKIVLSCLICWFVNLRMYVIHGRYELLKVYGLYFFQVNVSFTFFDYVEYMHVNLKLIALQVDYEIVQKLKSVTCSFQ